MSEYDYKTVLAKAKAIKKNVADKQELGLTSRWCYYICKQIIKPKTTVKGVSIKEASNPHGDYISRQIFKTSYMDMANRIIRYTERENQLPSTVKFTTAKGKVYHINIELCTEMFSRILVYYDKENAYPKYANINAKAFIKPTETGNAVFDLFVKLIGFKPTCLDDICDWVKNHVDYQFYYDDQKSNAEVIQTKAGNCTDLLQFLINMAEALGYEWEVIHTECRQSGTGHVYGKFRKKSGGEWFVRDIACIADESSYCVWCNVDTGAGNLLARNPSWFLQNLHR